MTTTETPVTDVHEDLKTRFDAVVADALGEVERRARMILRKHRLTLTEFVMAMGAATFITARGESLDTSDLRYMEPVDWFIQEWDDALHLTGNPMRFTADGPVVTEW